MKNVIRLAVYLATLAVCLIATMRSYEPRIARITKVNVDTPTGPFRQFHTYPVELDVNVVGNSHQRNLLTVEQIQALLVQQGEYVIYEQYRINRAELVAAWAAVNAPYNTNIAEA